MVSFSKADIDTKKIQTVAGDARLFIHCVGRAGIFNLASVLRRIAIIIRQVKPDFIRAYDISLRGALACYYARKSGIPSVISIHSNFDEQRKHDKRPLLQLRKLFERYSFSNCDMLICVSETLRRYAQKYNPKILRVIYNRVDLENFAPQKKDKPVERTRRLLSVARFVYPKKQECLIRAIKDLDVKLVLIGSGPKSDSLKKLAHKLGIMHKLEFISSVPQSRIHEYYRQADIFVHSSDYEGFCIPVIEAMACGLPIVASDLEVVSELTNGCASLCSNNPQDFTDAIKRLFSDPKLCQEAGEKARKRAEIFSSPELEKKEKDCYQELLLSKTNEA